MQRFAQPLDFLLFRNQELIGPGDQRVGFLKLGRLLAALGFSRRDVVRVALNQFACFLRALPVELDLVPQPGDFVLQALHLGAGIPDLAVHFIKTAPLGGECVFAGLDFSVRFAFGLRELRDCRPRLFQFRFQFVELIARMMRVEHLQIGVQRLVAPRLSRLALE